jgi:hypothetical protein
MDRNELEKSRLKQRKRKKVAGRKKPPLPKKQRIKKRFGEIDDRKKFGRKLTVPERKKPVFGDVTQGF